MSDSSSSAMYARSHVIIGEHRLVGLAAAMERPDQTAAPTRSLTTFDEPPVCIVTP